MTDGLKYPEQQLRNGRNQVNTESGWKIKSEPLLGRMKYVYIRETDKGGEYSEKPLFCSSLITADDADDDSVAKEGVASLIFNWTLISSAVPRMLRIYEFKFHLVSITPFEWYVSCDDLTAEEHLSWYLHEQNRYFLAGIFKTGSRTVCVLSVLFWQSSFIYLAVPHSTFPFYDIRIAGITTLDNSK